MSLPSLDRLQTTGMGESPIYRSLQTMTVSSPALALPSVAPASVKGGLNTTPDLVSSPPALPMPLSHYYLSREHVYGEAPILGLTASFLKAHSQSLKCTAPFTYEGVVLIEPSMKTLTFSCQMFSMEPASSKPRFLVELQRLSGEGRAFQHLYRELLASLKQSPSMAGSLEFPSHTFGTLKSPSFVPPSPRTQQNCCKHSINELVNRCCDENMSYEVRSQSACSLASIADTFEQFELCGESSSKLGEALKSPNMCSSMRRAIKVAKDKFSL